MKVTKTRFVDAAVRSLDDKDRRQVADWLRRLENWERDADARAAVQPMIYKDVYVLTTPDDLRLFLQMDPAGSEIQLIDIAKPSRFAGVPGAVPTAAG